VSGVTRHGKRVRFYSVVDLVNALEQEKAQGKAGRIAASLLRMDAVILDELGYLPFSQAGGAAISAEPRTSRESTRRRSRPIATPRRPSGCARSSRRSCCGA
jgi:hypothetical protein